MKTFRITYAKNLIILTDYIEARNEKSAINKLAAKNRGWTLGWELQVLQITEA